MHVLGARLPQRARAFVDGRARRVDVVHERQAARAGTRGECAAHVAAARRRIEASLRSHGRACAGGAGITGTSHQRSELARELRRRVGSAQQQAVAHGGHDGDRVDRGSRQLVDHQRGGQPRG